MTDLKKGMKAPSFTLPATGDRDISLEDYLGKKIVVLYFYGKDNTPA